MTFDPQDWREELAARFPDCRALGEPDPLRRVAPAVRVGQRVRGEVVARAPFGLWLDIGLPEPALLDIVYLHVDGARRPGRVDFDEYPPLGERLGAWVYRASPTGEVGLWQRGLRERAGDATRPEQEGPKIIVNLCNDAGVWAGSFAEAITARWPEPKQAYAAWTARRLGEVALVAVGDETRVANLVGERGDRPHRGQPPVRYEEIGRGLRTLAATARADGASVHLPRIGCGAAGGDWERMEQIVRRSLADLGAAATVYEPPA